MTEPATTTTPAPSTSLERSAPRPNVALGIAPSNVDEGWRLALMLAKGEDMIPKHYRNRPEAIMIAIQMGAELGFAPMQALSSIAVIGGRASVWGDGLLALVINSPKYQDHDEYYEVEIERTHLVDGRTVTERVMERRDGLTLADLKVDTSAAVCTFVRRGKPNPVTRRVTVGQARKAGYLPDANNKGGKEGPWQTHPDRMLAMRARGFAARDAFPDVLRGIRTVEEARDLPDDMDAVEAPPLRMVHRLSEQHPAPVPPSAPAPEPPPPPPPMGQSLGPLGVLRVEHLIGGPCVFLADGTQVWLQSDDDANEIEKFIGTSHRLIFSTVPVEGVPQQRTAISFAIAE